MYKMRINNLDLIIYDWDKMMCGPLMEKRLCISMEVKKDNTVKTVYWNSDCRIWKKWAGDCWFNRDRLWDVLLLITDYDDITVTDMYYSPGYWCVHKIVI